MPKNRRILLKQRPTGMPTLQDFELSEAPVPEPGEGEVLTRTLWMSLDPYMRGRMSDAKSYAKPTGVGEVMTAGTVGEVVTTRHPGFSPGDIVVGQGGWQEWAVLPGALIRKVDPAVAPISTAVGVLGMPGMTAYVGLLDFGRPKAGETVVVSAASGAVGAVVGQIAKIHGCRAVGIAGGAEKCKYVEQELGFDACVDHKAPDLGQRIAAACPKGIDVYFENVGGAVQAALWPLLNDFARIAVCGMIAHYNEPSPPPGPSLFDVLRRKLSVQGFIVSDHARRLPDFLRDMSGWVREGKVKYREDVVEGLEKAPEAFIGLLQGKNFGKLVVRVAK